ncbi:MAG: AMP-binding protein [Cycloclasticus sp.]|jgi:acetyl-CoA synthetase|nr:AMP-dependent synthetase [Cycloclasticus sp.]HIL92850.1 AMP-dependent synthetase [Cycloclasticus sp.]
MEFKPYPNTVWEPNDELTSISQMQRFIRTTGLADYDELLSKADEDPEWFWNAAIDFLDIKFYQPYDKVLDASKGIEWTQWCVGGKTNMVLNCLDKHKGTDVWDKPFIHHETEAGIKSSLTYKELDAKVCQLTNGLRSLGLKKGDAIGLYMPMIPEVAVAFLAIIKMGGMVIPLFSGFGPEPIIVRLNDGEAKAVITVDGTLRRSKPVNLKSTINEAKKKVPSLEHVIVFDHMNLALTKQQGDYDWHALTKNMPIDCETEVMDAEDPMMLVYTSGTTGMPKGTVQTHCGFMIKGMFDMHVLSELSSDDRMLWMSDMGWVVGPLEIMGVSYTGATLIMGEGAPNYPDPGRIWRFIDEYKVSWLGFAPTIARIFMSQEEDHVSRYDFSSLKVVLTTGEPWNPDAWLWFFDKVCGKRVPILNLTGGTEIGCGILGCTVLRPLKPCCFNTAIPAMGADILDEKGNTIAIGKVGELALRHHSIGLTRGLWNNPERYLDSYWRTLPGIWVHGDWAVKDDDGMWYVLGRSDDTLKIAGKRTGPAEIEGPLLATNRIVEAAVVGVPDEVGGSAVVCVCVPKPDENDESALAEVLINAVITEMGKSYKPKQIVFVEDLPKTRTMKVMRRVVKALLLGKEPGDLSSMVNPESLAFLKQKRLL